MMWLTMIRSVEVSSPHISADDHFLSASLQYIEHILAEEYEDDDGPSSDSSSTLFHHVNPMALQSMETSFFRALMDTRPHPQSRPLTEIQSGKNLPSNISGFLNYNGASGINDTAAFSSTIYSIADGAPSSNVSMSDHVLLQFKKGVEEAGKFLPRKNPLSCVVDFNANITKRLRPSIGREGRRKTHDDRLEIREGNGIQKGSSQAPLEEDDLLRKFQNLFSDEVHHEKLPLSLISEIASKDTAKGNIPSSGSSSKRATGPVVDLRTLLIECARSVHAGDHETSNNILTQIRKHSSPLGDASQRLGHYFANAIDSRLTGTGAHVYHAPPSVIDIMKAQRTVISVCPFQMINFSFMVHHISNLARKASTLHIVDFGISYGLQMSKIIDHVFANMDGRPLKFRVTGIEDAEALEMVKKTGHRLTIHCRRHNIQFEYNGIAQKWETIRIEDLKIHPDEAVAVTCLLRLHTTLDEAGAVHNPPRTQVLNLIRDINPSVFIHFAVNGSYSTPSFLPRFRELLFDYWTWFDMLDNNLSRENGDRLVFESFTLGPEIMNIAACEGLERVARAETYPQWKRRMVRAGFKSAPVDKGLMRTLVGMVKAGFHEDIVIEEDGDWMLQGWKGRILYSSSCWILSGGRS